MTALRTAAQQALEALEYPLNSPNALFDVDKAELLNHRAITALRAALAEPVQEPVVEEDKAPHPENYEITVLRQQIATYQTALDDALRRKHGS